MDEVDKKLIHVTLSIGADSDLSQADIEAILNDLQSGMGGLKVGPIDVIGQRTSHEGQAKGEPIITIAVAVIQFVVPKLIDIIYEKVKQHQNSQLKVVANLGGEQIRMDHRTDPREFEEIKSRLKSTSPVDIVPERRYALLIGTTKYQDTRLNQLSSPEVDIQALANVLKDPNIGGYDDVDLLLNQSSLAILQAVESFFKRKANTDLLLLYFSGHGIRGEDDSLYLAVENTNMDTLRATALSSSFIMGEMDRSKSERQILIMDCCYSGLFVHGAKGAEIGAPAYAANAFKGNGFGRVILTATDRTQVAWEGQKVSGQVQQSVFTHHLVEGLMTGEADHDRDGWIGLEELYKYIYGRMVVTTKDQTPEINAFNMKGSILLAKNPRPKPKNLSEELQTLIDSELPAARHTAVKELSRLLQSENFGMALAARKALEKLSKDDSRRVSEDASRALGLITSEGPRQTRPLPRPEPSGGSSPQQPPAPQPGQDSNPASLDWWTILKPLPGTRSAGGPKSGPIPVSAVTFTPDPVLPASPPTTTFATGPAQSGYPLPQHASISPAKADQTLLDRVSDSLRKIENLALILGILSLILFFLPISFLGVIVGIRAIKSPDQKTRAYLGLILSGMMLAIQSILLLYFALLII